MVCVDNVVLAQRFAYTRRHAFLPEAEMRWRPHLLLTIQLSQCLFDVPNAKNAAVELDLHFWGERAARGGVYFPEGWCCAHLLPVKKHVKEGRMWRGPRCISCHLAVSMLQRTACSRHGRRG